MLGMLWMERPILVSKENNVLPLCPVLSVETSIPSNLSGIPRGSFRWFDLFISVSASPLGVGATNPKALKG
jgi:hypothetical protein